MQKRKQGVTALLQWGVETVLKFAIKVRYITKGEKVEEEEKQWDWEQPCIYILSTVRLY